MSTPTSLVHPVPRAPGTPLDPPPELAPARDAPGMARVRLWDGREPWLVTRHADTRAVLADRRFSADTANPDFPFLSPPVTGVPQGPPSFIRMDDPRHQEVRRMLVRDFRVVAAEALRPGVPGGVDALVDRLHTLPQPVDLVLELALPLPSRVICLLLGVPYDHHEMFERCSTMLLDTSAAPAAKLAASVELRGYLAELAAERAARPTDDVLGRLAGREVAGEISREEVVAAAVLLLVAGHETTAGQTALSVIALLQHPDQLDRLRADPDLVPAAVEELLRYLSVVHTFVARVATDDVEVGGELVRRGDGLICMLGAANRDPAQFEDPDRLDVGRAAHHHVAFGHGAHQCLGLSLARVELQVALTAVVQRLPGLALAADPATELEFRNANVVYGVRSLPVTFTSG